MSPIMQITMLITFSVISQSHRASAETVSLDTVLFNNIQNKPEIPKQRNTVLCWICQATVHEVVSVAVHEIKKEVKAMCKKFKSLEYSCRKEAFKYEAMVIRLLFHGANVQDICKHLEMCN